MSDQILALHFDYEHNAMGSILKDAEGNVVKYDVGKEIACEGSWNDPGNMEQCFSAVSKLHSHHGQVGYYVPARKACIHSYFTLKRDKGCSICHLLSLFKTNGNPRNSGVVTNANKKAFPTIACGIILLSDCTFGVKGVV